MKKKGVVFPAVFLLVFLIHSNSILFSQKAKITAADYKSRRDKLCSMIPDGVAIITNNVTQAGFGRTRPNSDFYYLTGVDVPDAKLILVPEKVARKAPDLEYWKTTIYLPSRDPR